MKRKKMKKNVLYLGAGIIAVLVLVLIIWQVKTFSGSATKKSKESVTIEGKLTFETHCVRCHGNAGQGFGDKPDIRGSGLTAAEIKEIIKNGLDEMPSFSNIPDPALSKLAEYVSKL
jgi:mono/diheme cytochrome c family protein